MYILRNMDDLLFIDTGLGIYTDELLLELRELFPAFYSMNKRFLVTHADPDHCGLLSLLELQPEGKKRMAVDAFLRGYRQSEGERLGR